MAGLQLGMICHMFSMPGIPGGRRYERLQPEKRPICLDDSNPDGPMVWFSSRTHHSSVSEHMICRPKVPHSIH